MSATAHNQPEALAAEGLFFYDIFKLYLKLGTTFAMYYGSYVNYL